MIGRLALKKVNVTSALKKLNVVPNRHLSSSGGITRLGLDHPSMAQVVKYNGVVTISGQIDMSADDIEGQTKNILGQVDSLLGDAGTDKSKLLTASIWLKDIEKDFKTMNGIWNEWIDPENKPVRATGE